MKRFKQIGATLLEVMLVLAVAAMIIVMSIRYYSGAQVSQQINSTISQIQAISAAFDNLAIGAGSYSKVGGSTAIYKLIGSSNARTAVGGAVNFTSIEATKYTVTMQISEQACQSVKSRLEGNKKFTSVGCSGSGLLTYTYDNTQ